MPMYQLTNNLVSFKELYTTDGNEFLKKISDAEDPKQKIQIIQSYLDRLSKIIWGISPKTLATFKNYIIKKVSDSFEMLPPNLSGHWKEFYNIFYSTLKQLTKDELLAILKKDEGHPGQEKVCQDYS